MCRVIREARPAWIIGENVAGIVNLALDTVCADLEAEGYEVEPLIIPACAVDAPHRRDRVWIIARNVGDTQLNGCVASQRGGCVGAESFSWRSRQPEGKKEIEKREFAGAGGSSADVADTMCYGGKGLREQVGNIGKTMEGGSDSKIYGIPSFARDPANNQGGSQSFVGRVAYGIPNRTHRLKGLGNAIVPQVAAEIIRCIGLVHDVALSTTNKPKEK